MSLKDSLVLKSDPARNIIPRPSVVTMIMSTWVIVAVCSCGNIFKGIPLRSRNASQMVQCQSTLIQMAMKSAASQNTGAAHAMQLTIARMLEAVAMCHKR